MLYPMYLVPIYLVRVVFIVKSEMMNLRLNTEQEIAPRLTKVVLVTRIITSTS